MSEPFGKPYDHPLGGNISEYGPMVFGPARGVVSVAVDHHSMPATIDMTPEQAIEVGKKLIDYGTWMKKNS